MGKVANIKFSGGIINTPSDVSPMDGDLNECINLVPSDGELKPVEMPTRVFPAGGVAGVLAAVHNGSWGKNFIKANGNDIWFLDESMQPVEPRTRRLESEIQWVESVGNTLVIGTEKSIHYALYKDNKYKWLGDELPRPVFDFYVEPDETRKVSEPKVYSYEDEQSVEGLTVTDAGQYPYIGRLVLNDTTRRNIYNNILSKSAELHNKIKSDNKFMYPFFVRYSVKLFDGSHANHSAPLLMVPSSSKSPVAAIIDHSVQTGIGYWRGNIVLACKDAVLKYKFIGFCDANNNMISDISDWDDIIKGVDIFMSSQIQTSNLDYYSNPDNIPQQLRFFYPMKEGDYEIDLGAGYYNNIKTKHYDFYKYPGSTFAFEDFDLGIPSYSEDTVTERVSQTGIFYKAKEYSIDKLKSWGSSYKSYHDEVEYGYLANLETKQMLADEYLSRSRKSALAHYSYNKRLMLAGLYVQAPLWYIITETGKDTADYELTFVIEKPERTIVVKASGNDVDKFRFGHFIYYPDVDCKYVYVHMTTRDIDFNITNEYWAKIDMAAHTGLNGSYAMFDNLESLAEYMVNGLTSADVPQETSNRYYNLSSALIMSSVANPFIFNANNAIEVGSGRILGLASTSVPMSEGQYGQYPIIVFTDNGIHAVGIANDGTFTAVSPVSSSDSIMGSARIGQPNVISDGQSLYFITKRGLMELRGLHVRCVSEVLNGKSWNYMDYDNCINTSEGVIQYKNIVSMLSGGITDKRSFNQTVNDGDAFLAFDYKHNRIIVTDRTRESHWLYCIRDGKWSKLMFNNNFQSYDGYYPNIENLAQIQHVNNRGANFNTRGCKIVSTVFNWNESYVQADNGEIWDLMGALDENDDIYYKYGFMASRPIRFGSDEYKSLTHILHRKRIKSQNGFARMRLYGSVDGMRYFEINSLRGASFKYYVVLLYTCMKANERYSYMSVEFEEKFQNKLR